VAVLRGRGPRQRLGPPGVGGWVRQGGKLGRAYTFTVLAWEELAKCMIYRMVEIGLMSFELHRGSATALIRVDGHVLERHREKHTMIFLTLIGGEFIGNLGRSSGKSGIDPSTVTPEDIAQVTPKMLEDSLPEQLRPHRLSELPKIIEGDKALRTEVLALAAEAKQWDRLKNRGLYVGDGRSGIERPTDLTTGELDSLRHLFDRWNAINGSVIDGFPPNLVEAIRGFAAAIYSADRVGQTRWFFCQQCAREIKKGSRPNPALQP
jgi:AbiV